MLAVIPVRQGELPTGGAEVVAETGGRAMLLGGDVATAAKHATEAGATELRLVEAASFEPAGWAQALCAVLAQEDVIVVPGSPDGRDLAPRLAHALGRPLVSSAVRVAPDQITVARADGRIEHDVHIDQPIVAVLQPGVRSLLAEAAVNPTIETLELDLSGASDPVLAELMPADPATIDLAEAKRIVAGGAGLGEPAHLNELGAFGNALGASLGATRVLTDAGWIDHARQIGTTGVEVEPTLYIAMGISGAVQHIMGIGDPDHVISVNTDPSCPMMARADLAIVTDARALIAELNQRIEGAQ